MQQKWTNKLNNDEFNLIENDWYPLIKKSAMDKIRAQLLEIGQELQVLNPQESFKISAGEKLQDLPYLVLDFPRIAGPAFHFVCRTLFWWGRGIQFQIILKGKGPQVYAHVLSKAKESDYVLTGLNVWENDLDSGQFSLLKNLNETTRQEVFSREYIKLVRFKPIENTDKLFEGLSAFYQEFMEFAT